MCLSCLWLPILLSAAAVFIASSILWTVVPLHKQDYLPLAGSEGLSDWLKRARPATGRYMVGWCQPGQDPKAAPPAADVPRGLLLVQYGALSMGKTLGLWFFHVLVISLIVGYLAAVSLRAGAGFVTVFQVTGCTALLAYGGGASSKCIWEGSPWRLLPGALIDALVYGLATGALFAAFWPAA